MPLPQDGLQFVAKDADKFIGALKDVGVSYDSVTNRFRDASGKFTKGSNYLIQSGDAVAQNADKFVGAMGGASKGLTVFDGIVMEVGKKLVDFAINSVGKVIEGIGKIGKGFATLANEAAKLGGVAAGFGNFAAQTEAGAQAMLAALQSASAGMISTETLMTKFNDAAALVSVQFAERLPEGLEILSKVSAATGTDLNYLLDSYVKGIGRVSPMILDNLKIQVSQAEATARAAEMFGKEAEALTKVEQQMALTDITLEKLTEKFGGLPDVTQSATANLARIDAMFANIRAQLGSAFLPAWTTMTNAVANAVGFFSNAIQQGGLLFPILANLGAAASIAADAFETVTLKAIDFVDDISSAVTKLPEVTTQSLIQMQGETGTILSNIGDNLSTEMDSWISNALDWGSNIAVLIDGAATAITVAMNFISGMLSGWLAPGSPPKVAPDLPEWGIGAMTTYLEGFTQADYGILKGIQGPLSKVLGDVEFADISQEIARAMSEGAVDESLFDTIAASAGEYGTEIADLARLQFELVDASDALAAAEMAQASATDDVAAAQKRLEDSTKKIEETDKEVARLTEEYNQMLRAGATDEQLAAQLKLINAAEQQRDAAIEQNRAAQAGLDTAQDVKEQRDTEAQAAKDAAQAEYDAAQERLKNQQDLVDQLISLSQRLATTDEEEAMKKLTGPKGKIVPPEIVPPDLSGLDTAFDFTGGLTKAIENAKGLMLDKFGTIFDPIKAIIDEKFGPGSPIGLKWAEISDQIKAVWDEKLVPFWEGTLKPAIETVQLAFENMQTFWETSSIPEFAGQAFGEFLRITQGLAEDVIPFFSDSLLKISEWFVENGPLIDEFLATFGELWTSDQNILVEFWDIVEPILGGLLDTILNLVTLVLQVITGDWEGAWDTAGEIVHDMVNAAAESLVGFIDFLVKLAGGEGVQEFITIFTGIWDNALLIITTFGTNALTEVSNIIDAIGTWLGQQWEVFTGWGKNLIGGFSQGIADAAANLVAAAGEAVQGAIDAVKNLLRAKSPSQVFADIGTDTILGFAEGILGSQSIIDDAMGTMFGANALQPMVQASYAGANMMQEAQPMTREVSIQIGPNYFQSGDAQQLRAMVRQVLRDELRRN